MKTNKWIFSTFFLTITIVLLLILNIISNPSSVNGLVILIILSMFMNPVSYFLKINKKIVINKIYHYLIILYSLIISYITINTLIKYCREMQYNNNNEAIVTFYDNLFYMIVGAVLVIFISLFLKKEEKEYLNYQINYLYIVTAFYAVLSIINTVSIVATVGGVSTFILLSIILLKKNINLKDHKEIIIFLIILNILSYNLIILILLLIISKTLMNNIKIKQSV